MYLGEAPFSVIYSGVTLGEENTDARLDTLPVSSTADKGFNIRANWDLGEGALTYIGALNKWNYDFQQDVDNSDFDVLAALTSGAASGGLAQGGPVESELLSHEFRYSTELSENVDYIFGLYYADVETERLFTRTGFPADWEAVTGTESAALFGQVTWNLSDLTRLNVGGRYNYEKIEVDFTDNLIAQSYQSSASDSVALAKVSLQHDLIADMMVYGSVATGYKGQGYDITTSFTQDAADNPVDAETSISYELGVKAGLWDGRMNLNATAFNTQYDDYQAQNVVVDGTDFSTSLKVDNVGKLETYGLEVDGAVLVSENFTLNFGIAFIEATIKEWGDAGCYELQTAAQGCMPVLDPNENVIGSSQDLGGSDLNNSPNLKYNLGGNYLLPMGGMPFDGFVNFSYSWQDEVHFDVEGNPLTTQDAYGVFNLSGGITGKDDNYKVTVFVNNLFDEHYVSNIQDGVTGALFRDTGAVTTQVTPRGARRYVGVRAKYSF